MLLRSAKAVLLSCLLLTAGVAACALSSDARLLSMVPPDSNVIASMLRYAGQDQSASFLLLTENNRLDLQDFFAVSGADTSRSIHQVVFTAGAGQKGTLSEHSLLVSGHFDRDAIFRSARGDKATSEDYRAISILAVPAFERERSTLHDVRWLAILDSRIAIFGTREIVQRELDRYLSKSQPDPMLMERLSRLGRNDDSWCLLTGPKLGGVVQTVLENLDAQLGAVVKEGRPLEYGIHFGRRIEITASSEAVATTRPKTPPDAPAAVSPAASSFLPSSGYGGEETLIRTVVKVPRSRYEKWLDALSARSCAIGAVPR
jgi:hypothetical protein